EVGRLLDQDERADRTGFLTPPGEAAPAADRTASWPARVAAPRRPPGRPATAGEASTDGAGGFTPRQAIVPPAGRPPISQPPGRRAGAAARAADRLHPDPDELGPLEARRLRAGGPEALPRRRDDHPGPRGPHRPALDPLADPAGRAQGLGAGDDRPARRPGGL